MAEEIVAEANGIAEKATPNPHTIVTDVSEIPSTEELSPSATARTTNAESLRRTSSKIANLRAAFENRQNSSSSLDTVPKKRFERSPARNQEYETEIAKLKDQLEKELELRQAYEEKCTALEEENDDLNSRIEKKDATWKDDLQREHGNILQEKAQAVDEAASAQRQLSELKRSISSATHIESQVTDSTFASEMGTLQSEIQNWTVQNYRRAKTDTTPEAMCDRLSTIADRKQFELLTPVFRQYSQASKLAMLQTTIICYMMDIFEDPLLFGLSTHEEWRKSLKRTAETLPTILSPSAYNRWRAVTLDALRQCRSIKESVDFTALGMAEIICVTLGILTEKEDHEAKVSTLKTIVRRGISLAHLFRVQRARYEFVLPAPNSTFVAERMDDISVDGEATPESPVLCATFPCVLKLGDENGENPHLSNVVLKARVLRIEE